MKIGLKVDHAQLLTVEEDRTEQIQLLAPELGTRESD